MRITLTNLDEGTIYDLKHMLGDRVEELDTFLKTPTIANNKHARETLEEMRDNVKRNFNRVCDKERQIEENSQP